MSHSYSTMVNIAFRNCFQFISSVGLIPQKAIDELFKRIQKISKDFLSPRKPSACIALSEYGVRYGYHTGDDHPEYFSIHKFRFQD